MPRSMPSVSLPQELCNKFCHPELVERISMWRTRVHRHSSCELQTPIPSTTKLKNRHRKPYARPNSSAQSPTSNLNGCDLPQRASVPPVAHEGSAGSVSFHDSYRPTTAYRGLYGSELPDPVRSPLKSANPSYLAGEYCRIMLFHDQLQIQRRQLEIACLRKVGDRVITQHLLDIGAVIQRITKSTQYIVALSQEYGLNLDFNTIYAKYCDQILSPPPPTQEPVDNFIKMPQARPFSEAWKFNPL